MHKIGLDVPQLPGERGADLLRGAWRSVRRILARIHSDLVALDGGAAIEAEVLVGGDEGRVGPVELDATALRGPAAAVPHAEIELHGAEDGERRAGHDAGQVAEHADGSVVHIEHQQILVPLEVVVVVVQSGVKPQVELNLAPAHSLHEDVGVQNVGLPAHVAQKLVVEFAVRQTRRR